MTTMLGGPVGDSSDGGAPTTRALRVRSLLRTLTTVGVLAAAYLGAYLIRFEFVVPPDFQRTALVTLVPVVALQYTALQVLRAHRHSWRYTSLYDVVAVVEGLAASFLVLAGLRIMWQALRVAGLLADLSPIPWGVLVANLGLAVLGLIGVRALRRLEQERAVARGFQPDDGGKRATRVVLLGAGTAGAMVATQLRTRPDLRLQPVGFLDDDPVKHRQVIHGLEVLGGRDALADVVHDLDVEEAIITVAEPPGRLVRELTELCTRAGISVRIVPGVHELLGDKLTLSRIRRVAIDDLLRRDPVELDSSAIAEVVAGRTVVVTGAGGSIGSELCRQLTRFEPARLVLVDRAEPALWAIHHELVGAAPDLHLDPVIADVGDTDRIRALLVETEPTVVFHAAAHKHVPIMEHNPGEAIKNNVFGTVRLVDACAAVGVPRFVLISTDKAVRPSSVMGATKRVAERYVQHVAERTGHAYVSVRFGNVLGSTGSVVPIFQAQIEAGGPVTITHPDMRRYFMTIPEASALVVQAAVLGTGAEVFVLDMGEPMRIVDLARDLIRLSGLEPDVDVAIEFTGIRPGEKLYEELSLDSEDTDVTSHPAIDISRAAGARWEDVDADLAALRTVADGADVVEVRAVLARIVPELLAPVPDGAVPTAAVVGSGPARGTATP